MSSESITIYKLIILYMLSRVDAPLPAGIISDYVTEYGYTNFFNLQNAFGELLQTDLIADDSTYRLSYYTLTPAGREILDEFSSRLSPETRKEIKDYLNKHRFQIVDETSLVSDYRKTADKSYLATCVLKEGNHILFQLSLDVTTEEDARKICENWQKASATLYQKAVQMLLSH